MDIWVITAWDGSFGYTNEVLSILFDEDLVMPRVKELFERNETIYLIRVEVWNREEGTWDASYCSAKEFHREDMVG